MKKLGLLALEGMADKLEYPSERKEDRSIKPQPVENEAGKEERERK